jgi:hypothetical protein
MSISTGSGQRLMGAFLGASMAKSLIAEHIVELQTMQLFMKNVADNVYPGGARRDSTQIKCDFMRTLQSNVLNNPPTTDGSTTNSNKPLTRIMQVQGWEENWSVFVFLERAINAHKERVSQHEHHSTVLETP